MKIWTTVECSSKVSLTGYPSAITFGSRRIKYARTCAYFEYLHFKDLSDSFLFKNVPSFYESTDLLGYDLNCTLKHFALDIYLKSLTSSILSPYAFLRMESLGLTGLPGSIQSDLFKSFRNLRSMNIVVWDFGKFVHVSQLTWLSGLNLHVNFISMLYATALTDQTKKQMMNETFFLFMLEDTSFSKSTYSFPDEDFCIFDPFPHTRLTFPFLFNFRVEEYSCTAVYLLQYVYKKKSIIGSYQPLWIQSLYNVNDSFFEKNDQIYESCSAITQCLDVTNIRTRR